MNKIITHIFFLLISVNVAFSQGNTALFKMADKAVAANNYDAAVIFYKAIINNVDSGRVDGELPYGVRSYTAPPKKKYNLITDEDSVLTDEKTKTDAITNKETIASTEDTSQKSVKLSPLGPQKLRALQKLHFCYYKLHSYDNAYTTAKNLFDHDAPNAGYYLARSLVLQGKYEEAITILDDYMITLELDSEQFKLSKKLVKQCRFGIKQLKKRKTAIINKLDSTINSKNGAFGAAFIGDNKILFSSAKPRAGYNEELVNSNLFTANINDKGDLEYILEYVPSINSIDQNEAAGCVSPDGNKLFFTRWNYDLEEPECAIYVCKNLNGQWLTPRKLSDNINIPGYRTMQPQYVSEYYDGRQINRLFFASDRPGGEGGLDIWYCVLDFQDNTKEVVNVGKVINTKGDEQCPFAHFLSESFYFSSNGHKGMGGLDVFNVTMAYGEFNGPVTNLGSPINSHGNDAYYVVSENKSITDGFISSDRDSCNDCGGRNCYQLYSFKHKSIVITITGIVTNGEDGEIIPNSLISFIDVTEKHAPVYVFTDENGEYKATLQRDVDYFASAQKKGFFKDAVALNTHNINVSTDLIQDFNFYLQEIPDGEILISGIEYDFNSATLRPRSKFILDTLVGFLELNDNIVIEINAHTDERGNSSYNKSLSERRAQSVVNYLITNGIEKARLVANGMGEDEPLVPNARTEADHQRNRRTAFKTLSQDYQPAEENKYIPENMKR